MQQVQEEMENILMPMKKFQFYLDSGIDASILMINSKILICYSGSDQRITALSKTHGIFTKLTVEGMMHFLTNNALINIFFYYRDNGFC